MSYADAVQDFIHTMELEGVAPSEPVVQRLSGGELIRFHCEGDGKGRQNGWAILYLDERPAGAFGNYRLGISRKWKAGDDRLLTADERQQLSREWAAAKQRKQDERARSEAEAARDAADLWLRASPAAADHGYVSRKRLDPTCLRQVADKLLVPMFDASGSLWNLQRIAPDGSKRFLRGGRTAGLFCLIGAFARGGERACLGEGYATMSAVHRASGYPCITAFSAKNLAAVGRVWRDARPDLEMIICADDDGHLSNNIGIEAATAAAAEIGARLAIPPRAHA